MGPSWDTPFTVPGDWPDVLIPVHWPWVLQLVAVMTDDAISNAEWPLARSILDDLRDPDVETANARWREFVCALWRMRNGWMARYRARTQAARR